MMVPIEFERRHPEFQPGMIARFALCIIRIYQLSLAPLLPNVCRYVPSCSNYAMEAITRHGVFRGTFLGIYRILRCNPFSSGGYDPVPDTLNELSPFGTKGK